ncbi:MAG: LacI family DNA-binding transcriptional regulator [Rhodospirillaceae bacterium]|nr:LacI family DNA-binding transcriptional regulator [Rhodospirillaceae bacterium]
MKRVAIADVARAAGVSVTTVSRVMNGQHGRFSADTVERVRAAVDRLGYRPAEAGRALRTRQSRVVALLVPDAANEFCAAAAGSIETALRARGLAMMLCNTGEDPARQDDYLAEMASHGVRAVILLGAVDSPGLRAMLAKDFPIVFINRRPPKGMQGHFLGIDDYAAGRAVAEELLRLGRRRCAAIHGPLWSSTSAARLQGFLDRMGEAGVRLVAQHRRESALTIEDGYRHAVALLARPPRPDAVFCGNDLIAYGVHRRCTELGLSVPGEVLLFGFDDNPRNPWLAPWLSTVQVPVDQFGPRAAALIDALPARRQQAEVSNVLLPFSVVLRGEAAPAGADGTPHRRPPRKKRPTTTPSTQPGGNR